MIVIGVGFRCASLDRLVVCTEGGLFASTRPKFGEHVKALDLVIDRIGRYNDQAAKAIYRAKQATLRAPIGANAQGFEGTGSMFVGDCRRYCDVRFRRKSGANARG